LHEQRKVTRSVGAKAFEVEVVVAAAFNSKSNARAAEQAPLYEKAFAFAFAVDLDLDLNLNLNLGRSFNQKPTASPGKPIGTEVPPTQARKQSRRQG
jgi:hypothetical protein